MQRKGTEARGAAPSYRTLLEHPFKHQRLASGLIGRLLHEGRRVVWVWEGEGGMECAFGVLSCTTVHTHRVHQRRHVCQWS